VAEIEPRRRTENKKPKENNNNNKNSSLAPYSDLLQRRVSSVGRVGA